MAYGKCDICGKEVDIFHQIIHKTSEGNKIAICEECNQTINEEEKKEHLIKKEQKKGDEINVIMEPRKMDENICSICNEKIGIGRQKLPLKNIRTGQEFLFCSKCYEGLPKEEKLGLEPMKNVKGAGFLAGFAFGGIFGAAGYSSEQNKSIMNPIKQFNLTLPEINTYSIRNYNKHFLFCDDTLKSGIMYSMGKMLQKEKLNQLSKQHFLKDFDLLDRKEQKTVKKELKLILEENMKKNKHLKNLKTFLELENKSI